MKQAQKRPKSGKRKALTVLNCFLAVILALMLGVTMLAHALMNKMNRVESPQPDQTLGSNVSIAENDGNEDQSSESLLGAEKDIVNILLIGQDRREGEERARSDAMILVTINKNNKSVILTSFLRDLYVSIPGYGSNRINASYAWGGMGLLNETLAHNFGIHVDGNLEVDFNQFSDIVDILGGVPMELRADEAKLINSEVGGSLTEGMQLLSGDQALTYARIRKLDADADFSRTNRQRKVLSAIFDQLKDAGLMKLLELLDEVLPMVTTDMSNGEILGYAVKVFPLMSKAEITSQRVPADGAYSGAMVNGMAVLVADMDKTRQILQDTLGG